MQEKQYTNEELAKDFFRVATIQVASFDYYLMLKKAIARYKCNIQDLYQKEGNLDKLAIPILKRKTSFSKRILESILEKGVEETEKEITEERTSQARREATSPYHKYPSVKIKKTGWPEDDFAFDIAVKKYEKD